MPLATIQARSSRASPCADRPSGIALSGARLFAQRFAPLDGPTSAVERAADDQPHPAAVDDQAFDAARGERERASREIAGQPVIADARAKHGDRAARTRSPSSGVYLSAMRGPQQRHQGSSAQRSAAGAHPPGRRTRGGAGSRGLRNRRARRGRRQLEAGECFADGQHFQHRFQRREEYGSCRRRSWQHLAGGSSVRVRPRWAAWWIASIMARDPSAGRGRPWRRAGAVPEFEVAPFFSSSPTTCASRSTPTARARRKPSS